MIIDHTYDVSMRFSSLSLIPVILASVGLLSCTAPNVEITKEPIAGMPSAKLSKLDSISRSVLKREGLDKQYRKDPHATLNQLMQRHQNDPEHELLLTTARLCESLGDDYAVEDPYAAAGCYLDAARLSYPSAVKMASSGVHYDLRLIYNESCSKLAQLLQQQNHDWSQSLRLKGPLQTYSFSLSSGRYGIANLAVGDELYIANRIALKGADLDRRYYEGIGGALIGLRPHDNTKGPESNFVPSFGLLIPVNSIITFNSTGARAELILSDLRQINEYKIKSRKLPMSSDWSALVAYMYQYAPTEKAGFDAMIHPAEFDNSTKLIELTPYQPDKIPLVFVHGLMSSPETWIDMIAALGSDPVIRKNYQPLVFRYSTGYPIVRNAAELRSRLKSFYKMAAAEGGASKLHRTVVIGHSMGGILANMQIRNSGNYIRDLVLEQDTEELNLSPENRKNLEELMFFEAVPSIERAIFIAAPHRGSPMATQSLGNLGSRLIQLPADIYNTGISLTQLDDLMGLTPFASQQIAMRPDSIKSLRPNSTFLEAVLKMPVAQRVKSHTIVGQTDLSVTLKESSDKVVPYWSAHIPGVDSEHVVNANHLTITGDATSIEEVRKLLYLHLGKKVARPLTQSGKIGDQSKLKLQMGNPNKR